VRTVALGCRHHVVEEKDFSVEASSSYRESDEAGTASWKGTWLGMEEASASDGL
jgi:hypothetical protein